MIGPWIPFFLRMSFINSTVDEFFWNLPIYFIVGAVLFWTFLEYYTHRFDLHVEHKLDENEKADPDQLYTIFTRHVHHHVFMN